MFKQFDDLDDVSASGIVQAVNDRVIADDVTNRQVIENARRLVDFGHGDWEYVNSFGGSPQWRISTNLIVRLS